MVVSLCVLESVKLQCGHLTDEYSILIQKYTTEISCEIKKKNRTKISLEPDHSLSV